MSSAKRIYPEQPIVPLWQRGRLRGFYMTQPTQQTLKTQQTRFVFASNCLRFCLPEPEISAKKVRFVFVFSVPPRSEQTRPTIELLP
jgi:hypothetical protein